jgi:MerR family redox-sensitive transcriptional activator SoxR
MSGMQSTKQLTIGELATSTGVARSALRYWEELGLLPAPARVSGQRRYPASAVELVAEILLLQDAGFTLRELEAVLAARSDRSPDWRELCRRKLADLDERIARTQAARTAVAHAVACRHHDLRSCPTFAGVLAARLAGAPLHQAHPH